MKDSLLKDWKTKKLFSYYIYVYIYPYLIVSLELKGN